MWWKIGSLKAEKQKLREEVAWNRNSTDKDGTKVGDLEKKVLDMQNELEITINDLSKWNTLIESKDKWVKDLKEEKEKLNDLHKENELKFAKAVKE